MPTTARSAVPAVGHPATEVRFDAPHDPKSTRGMRRALSRRPGYAMAEKRGQFNSSI